MFSDTAFWRLVWKEYRVQRSLLIAMLIVAPVVQLVAMFLFWIDAPRFVMDTNREFQHIAMNIAVIVSAIYVLCCAATMFSEEHETGSFDFQRLLPTSSGKALGAKLVFALGSGIIVTAWLWGTSLGLFARDAEVQSAWMSSNFFIGLLVHLELLAWGILASLLIRQPLWAAIVAAAGQTVTTSFALQNFERMLERSSEWWHAAIVLVLSVLNFVLARLWIESRLRWPQWRWRMTRDVVVSYPRDIELPAYVGQRQTGWARLLWLSWRDSRWIIASFLAFYFIVLMRIKTVRDWEILLVPMYLSCGVFGLYAFVPEQWGGRFRYMTEQGVSPRAAWWCRQVVWWLPILLMVGLTNGMRWQESGAYSRGIEHDAFESMLCTVLPWVLYAAGQFASMLCRSTPVAIAVTLALCALGGAWAALMIMWLAPAWWAVGAWFVIGLFVTWLRAPDWIEERRDRTSRRRLWRGIGIPFALLLVALGTYRVVQIPTVTLPTEWDDDAVVKARLSPAQLETLDVYRRAFAAIVRVEAEMETYPVRTKRLKREHPDWSTTQIRQAAFTTHHQEWYQKCQHVVPLVRTAHQMPAVPINLLGSEFSFKMGDNQIPARGSVLLRLMEQEIHSRIDEGDLAGAWDDIEIGHELLQRISQCGAPQQYPHVGLFDPSGRDSLLRRITKWGQHANQMHERLLTAIRKLEQYESSHRSVQLTAHNFLLASESILKFDESWQTYIRGDGVRLLNPPASDVRSHPTWMRETAAMVWPKVWTGLFWERWRSGRMVRWQAARALDHAEVLEQAVRDQRSVPRVNYSVYPPRLEGRGTPEETVQLEKLNADSRLSIPFSDTTILPPYGTRDVMSQSVVRELIQHHEQYRVTMLLLALADYQRAHGRYPASLSELAPTYFREVPRDPSSGGPFVYFPHGVSHDFTNYGGDVPKDVPFLVTNLGDAQFDVEPQSDGTWKFRDHQGKPVAIELALQRLRIHRLESAQKRP